MGIASIRLVLSKIATFEAFQTKKRQMQQLGKHRRAILQIDTESIVSWIGEPKSHLPV
jgi:hypothetical protein